MTRPRFLLLLAVAFAFGVICFLWLRPTTEVGTAVPSRPSLRSPATQSKIANASVSDGSNISALAETLNSPATGIAADLRLLDDLFATFRTNLRENPVGSNADITAALTGANSLRLALLPRDHPAINAAGELCDRWGTPFFFHQLSGTQMEIRSAGPDQKLWTADDTIFTP
jgi:hypothetical protein